MHEAVLIEDLAVVLCVAALVLLLFQKINQPPILGYLIAGLIIGPYTPPFSFIDDEVEILLLAQLGVIFLMFSLGLEFTLNKLVKVGLPALFTAVFEVLCMIGIGFLGGKALGWNTYECILIGMALSISSTTIIIKSLENLNLKKMAFSALMVGILIIEDLLAILMLVFVYTIGSMEVIEAYPLAMETIKLLLMVLSWFFLGFFFIPSLMNKINSFINQETLTILSIGLCLFLSGLAAYFNYSAALGAFIMGTILAETKEGKKIEILTLPIRDIFLAVFFVSVGMLIDPMTIFSNWDSVLFFTLLTIVGKIVTSAVGAIIAGETLENSLKVGFGMAQIGEFSFIIIGIGGKLFSTSDDIYPIIIAVATITTFTTPYLIKYGIPFCDSLKKVLPSSLYDKLQYFANRHKSNRRKNKSLSLSSKRVIRFVLNGLITSIIFTGTLTSVPLLFRGGNPSLFADIVFLLIGLAIALPFLWAMLFYSLPSNRLKRLIVGSLCWIVTFGLLYVFAMYHTHSHTLPFGFLLLALILLLGFYKPLKILYIHVEKIFLDNLNLKLEPTSHRKEAKVWKKH